MARRGDVKVCRLCGEQAVLTRIPEITTSMSGADGGAIANPIPPQDVWGVIDKMPCVIKLLPVVRAAASFHDFDGYERLVEEARKGGWRTHLIVLLGGEAGLRCGEMVALHWSDVDFANGQLCVRHSDWRGQLTAPKNGRVRYVPMTERLASALREYRHLRGLRVL